jgi:hypothetical protein
MRARPVRHHLKGPALAAALAVSLGSATACTAENEGSAPAPSPTETASPSPTPSPEDVERAIGEPASFTLRTGSGRRSRVRVAVTDVTEGRIRHLSDFVLDTEGRRSTPYYAHVRVANIGGGNLSRARITLWGFDSSGTVRPPAEVLGTFPRCQTRRAPKRFRRGDSMRTCLVYLVPRGSTLQAVQYRFSDDRPPVSWPVG